MQGEPFLIFAFAYLIEAFLNLKTYADELSKDSEPASEHLDDLESLLRLSIERSPALQAKLSDKNLKNLFGADNYQSSDRDEIEHDADERGIYRERRRLNVFKNIYHKCRIQKKNDRDKCFMLASMYQSVKGFHGL